MVRLLAIVATAALCTAKPPPKQPYEYFCVGNCDEPKATPGVGGIVMGGGGTDVDENFPWMAKRGGGGDFLILRASGTDAYNQWILDMGGLNSVSTLITTSRAASEDPFVVGKIRNASAIWFAGGDQSQYVDYWTGTSVQTELQAAADRGVPFGGTSAGDAVLTGFVTVGAATSAESLKDPYNVDVNITDAFLHLPFVKDVHIADMHFVTRDRMGRSLAFLARLRQDGKVPAGVPLRAICTDEHTSVIVDPATGMATLLGAGTAYFLSASGAPLVCQAKKPLSFSGIEAYRLTAGTGGSFDLAKWSGKGGVAYGIDVESGTIKAEGNGYGPTTALAV